MTDLIYTAVLHGRKEPKPKDYVPLYTRAQIIQMLDLGLLESCQLVGRLEGGE